MSSKPVKNMTAEEKWARDRIRIHALKTRLTKEQPGYSDDNYRDLVRDISKSRTESSKELTERERFQLIQRLQVLAGEQPTSRPWTKRDYPKRPKNMDKKGDSRSDQLGKIEALLTIGKLSWTYADAIAKQMRLADKVQWVPEGKLHYIITALTKKAKKEGWDLSGAK